MVSLLVSVIFSPMFIDIEGGPVSLETFVSSFKARGNIADDVMSAHSYVFNEESKISALKKPFLKKHMLSSFIAVSFFPTVITLFILCISACSFFYYIFNLYFFLCITRQS